MSYIALPIATAFAEMTEEALVIDFFVFSIPASTSESSMVILQNKFKRLIETTSLLDVDFSHFSEYDLLNYDEEDDPWDFSEAKKEAS